jgi:hypothetical protein
MIGFPLLMITITSIVKTSLSYKGTVPGIVQATLPPYNLGEVKNWGNEIELSYNSVPGKFTWWVKGNASTNNNKITFQG